MRQFPLCDARMLQKDAHDGKLIGRNLEMGSSAAKGLVKPVPGPTKEGREPFALRCVNGQKVGILNWIDSRHN